MRTLQRLEAGDVVAVVSAYRDVLRLHQGSINRLNVYPVPDGDTGTNMALTVQSVADALADADGTDLASVADAISLGSLMGARGNSGVILSQILRGIADAVRASAGVDGPVVVDGLRRASEGAYRAVETPVEGTILTVVRAAADGAAAAGPVGLVGVLEAARAEAAGALARTPDLLPVLRAAGVVDSGGTGLLLLFDAFLHVAAGRELPAAEPAGPGVEATLTTGTGAGADGAIRAGPGCRYEVMYLLEAPDEAIGSFRSVWAGIGDSIVVVGGDGTYNCHIHTDDIGAAVEAALDAGRPRRIRVSDLWDEVEEERWVREAVARGSDEEVEVQVGCGVVAVCTGEGVRRIFHSLGVNRTVLGGQSMNPSTAELLAAIEAVPAPAVIVLPNNANVVAVAKAAASRSDKAVAVVPTRNVPEGFAALLDYDPEAAVEQNAATMRRAAGRVVAGEITQAVRSTAGPAGPIQVGDFIGVSHDGILSVATTVSEAATRLLEALIDREHHEIVTAITGDGATPADTRRITSWLAEHHEDIGVEVHQGGQPLYPYLFGIE
jgi:DAK2 domain fusion protein YloV